MKYKVEITETLQRVVEVEAKTLTEAIEITFNARKNGEIILDESDFVEYDIHGFKEV